MVAGRGGAGGRVRRRGPRPGGARRPPGGRRRGARPARRRLLRAAQRRAPPARRGHLHAGRDRRRDGRLGGRAPGPGARGRSGGRLGPLRGRGRTALSPGADRRRGARPPGGHDLPGPPGGGRARRARHRPGGRLPHRRPGRRGGAHPVPRQPALRAPPPDPRRAARSGSPSRPGPTASRPASWPGCTCTSSWPRRRAPGRATGARWSPPPSGSTPTTAGWCASCCWGPWAASRSTCWSPPRSPSRTRRSRPRSPASPPPAAGRRPSGCAGWRASPSWTPWRAGARWPPTSLAESRRWTPLTRAPRAVPADYVELGEICRVHRGAVTGRNATWVVRPGEADLPEEVLFPCITRAREIFDAGARLSHTDHLRRVVDLPLDLDVFASADRARVERFLRRAPQRRRPRRLHRPRPARLVVGGAAPGRADPRHLHGAPSPGLHPQHGRRAPHQHRPRPVPARAAGRGRPGAPGGGPARGRSRWPTGAPTPAASPSSSRARWSGCASPTPSCRRRARDERHLPAAPALEPPRPGARGHPGRAELPARARAGAPRPVPRPRRRLPGRGRRADRADRGPDPAARAGAGGGHLRAAAGDAALRRRAAHLHGRPAGDRRHQPGPRPPARRPRGRRPHRRQRAGRAGPPPLPLDRRAARARASTSARRPCSPPRR